MNKEINIHSLDEYLKQIPAIGNIEGQVGKNGLWKIKFRINIDHTLAWRVIQELANVANYLPDEDRLPTRFYPISPAPYLNGGPGEYLYWIIENTNSKFGPEDFVEWLEARLPDPVDDRLMWEEEE